MKPCGSEAQVMYSGWCSQAIHWEESMTCMQSNKIQLLDENTSKEIWNITWQLTKKSTRMTKTKTEIKKMY